MEITISVIIPTYKPKAYLWECLDSLVGQTLDRTMFEVLLVLNGCCEPYKSDIERYIAEKMQGMNVRFIQTDQGGVSNARNIALDRAKGEYVTFVDDDDYVSPPYLEKLLQAAGPNTLSLSDVLSFIDGTNNMSKEYDPHKNFIEISGKKGIKPHKCRKYFNFPVAKLIHRKMVSDCRFDIRFKNGEDSLFMFTISKNIKKIATASPDAVYYRRIREGSACMVKRPIKYHINNSLKLIEAITITYLKHPLQYDLRLYISRILAPVKVILYKL